MCYYYSLTPSKMQGLVDARVLTAQQAEQLRGFYFASGFDNPLLPVLTAPGVCSEMHWGLVPHWVRSAQQASELRLRTINARAETAYDLPSFRYAIRHQRCVVPCSGFYEWHKQGRQKYPFYVQLRSQEVFLLAGVWDRWIDPATHQVVHSFAILTTRANELMSMVHNSQERMPVVLAPEQASTYLQTDATQEQIQALLQPSDSAVWQAWPVRRFAPTDKRWQADASVQVFFPYPELGHMLSRLGLGSWRSLFD